MTKDCLIPNTTTWDYKTLDDIENEVVYQELPNYIGGILNEIVQGERGGYFSKSSVKRSLDRIFDLLDNEYIFKP
tara:strand:+ start:421 stop:645 length:225 start_codon:yes stop_codon:yes gene_type:complete